MILHGYVTRSNSQSPQPTGRRQKSDCTALWWWLMVILQWLVATARLLFDIRWQLQGVWSRWDCVLVIRCRSGYRLNGQSWLCIFRTNPVSCKVNHGPTNRTMTHAEVRLRSDLQFIDALPPVGRRKWWRTFTWSLMVDIWQWPCDPWLQWNGFYELMPKTGQSLPSSVAQMEVASAC